MACSPAEDSTGEESLTESERRIIGFDRDRVVGNETFVNMAALDEAAVQAFLQTTPYGTQSVLATHIDGEVTAARAIVNAATNHRINPLAILVRAQMEQSLIGRSTVTERATDYAFGCGCPDNKPCDVDQKGFPKQVECMASRMRGYLDDLEAGDSTVSGWRVGEARESLDKLLVTPRNHATAALYTYTPWVGGTQVAGGNASHFKIWKIFAAYLGLEVDPNCGLASFPSTEITTVASAPLSADIATLTGQSAQCFVDVGAIDDPATLELSPHFTLAEFIDAEPSSRYVALDAEFVKKLEQLRSITGEPITIVDGHRSPERHRAQCAADCPECEDSCAVTAGLVSGRGAVVQSSASAAVILAAARQAGMTNCLVVGDRIYVDDTEPRLGCL